MTNLEFAIALAKSEKEEDTISLLQTLGYWDNNSMWKPLGNNDNNYSIIGNQQRSPDAAFVEKVINSIDACLTKECLKRGINPMGPDAPQSITDALEQFYEIKSGGLKLVPSKRISELAQNIIVAATGARGGQINLCIADQGEGQTPKHMPDTILSVSKSNKLKIPFVQGKFNMGGTGALLFCGNHHLQLIISKRCPDIPNTDIDDTYDKWSVTVIRKESPREGRKSSMYTYLTDPSGSILTFETDSLPIIPMKHIKGITGFKYENMSYGTFIKLYNYQLTGYKTNITLDFYNRLSLLIPNLALPILFRECREFNADNCYAYLSGLVNRIYEESTTKILENGFPTSSIITVDGQKIFLSVYLLKPGKEKTYRSKNAGIIFCVNGQTHDIIKDSRFSRVNLSYIKNSILVITDCSEVDIEHQEQLFMPSRDRLRNSAFTKEIILSIEKELREHPGLKKAAHERRNAAIHNKLADNKPLKDVLQNILEKSDVLSKLFKTGWEIFSPFNTTFSAGEGDSFEGKLHPTFFKLKGKLKGGKLVKTVPCNASFRVQFDTDVQNDYFNRPSETGTLVLKMDGVIRPDLIKHLSLYNGQANLTVSLPINSVNGDAHIFETTLQDDYIVNSFRNTFYVNVTRAEEPHSGGSGQLHKPTNPNSRGNRQTPSRFAMPAIIPVKRDEWEQYDMDRYTGLVYCPTDNGGDYFLNMENDFLLSELKGIREPSKVELTKARYTYSMALIGMSVISYYKNNTSDANEVDIPAVVKRVTSMISPILIPMLQSMADLEIGDMSSAA